MVHGSDAFIMFPLKNTKIRIFLIFLLLQKIVKRVKDIGLPPKYLIKYIDLVWICCLINGFIYSLDPRILHG